jgi:glycosyltransferase involved in cell wall biosynthesis
MQDFKEFKVLYLINHSVPYGANKALLNILDGLIPYGVRPTVIMAFEGAMCEELKKRNIQYHIIEHYFSIYPSLSSFRDISLFLPRLFRTYFFNFIAKRKLVVIAKEFNPKLIHTNIGPVHIGYCIAKKLVIPHVWHIREYQDLDFNMHPLYSKADFIKKLHNSINHSIVITKGVFDHFILSNNNAKVIYDGVLKENNVKFEFAKEKYFLFVGRLEEAKGIKNLLIAFVEFCKSNSEFELRIAGDGELQYKDELKKYIETEKLGSRVRFLGFREDIPSLMVKATALVVPSRYEGFGFITVEAMFNGCLVIGNNKGGTREILEEENLGILYSNHQELVLAMKTVVTEEVENYYEMILKAQKKAVALYSQEQNAKSIFDYYKEILHKQKKT